MAIKAQGTLLKAAVALGTTYTTVGSVVSFNGPTRSRAMLDITNLGSTAREKAAGLTDNGSLSISMQEDFADAGQDNARAAFASGALTNWQIVIPAGIAPSASVETTLAFTAVATQYSRQGAVDGLIQSEITLMISGPVTETP